MLTVVILIKNKYRLLGDDKTSFAGNRPVISHTVEVSTLGLASDTKDFTSIAARCSELIVAFGCLSGIELIFWHLLYEKL